MSADAPRAVTDHPQAERRLAAILVADIVGYSRMMGADEAGTLRRLKALRRELINPQIAVARGRIVKTMGDGLLVEFPSPVRAVACAVRIQQAMPGREPNVPPENQFRLRFGINVGDVMADPDGDLYGDGVNVAARLEPLAEPGGLCVSRSVYDQVRDRLPYVFEDRGKLELKNIARPIGVFALSSAAIAGSPGLPEEVSAAHADEPVVAAAGRQRPWRAVTAGLLALGMAGTGLGWWLATSRAPTADRTLAVQAGLPAKPLPPLSLVVLPFANLSPDPEQEFFADGMTEDLTTDVSRLAGSFVIARNTAFTYKGKAIDVKQLGRDLGVRYALEGSVRRTGEQIVLNAQLISTETGAHLWADRFEGERSQLGELQAQFVARLARSLDVQLTEAETARIRLEHPDNPGAADLAMLGWAHLNKPRNAESTRSAIEFFKKSLALEPDNLRALQGLARGTIQLVTNRWSTDRPADIKRAEDLADRVIAISPNSSIAYFVKGDVYASNRDFNLAMAMYGEAIKNDPNFPESYTKSGNTQILMGHAARAFDYIDKAIRISPRDGLLNVWYYNICHAHSHLQHWSEAISWCSKSLARGPYWIAYVDIAAAYAWTGKDAEAHDAVEKLLKLMPGYTVQKWATAGWSENPRFLEEYAYLVQGLRRAGLPEGDTAQR
ncbi:adenylate/guanylate cyclase domain-containing protein [Methylobacterium sp. PvR107]|uniref:adenylate/guanylate cyclase domain-containing protein n=1 Tax=Methylobacterium sp. PvR107 TaxID=2806597 RepID=UPI001B494C5F|nr:adenylate/guanylate cyclase domain-containing protein [Methylobacterium sp. PvR107]MBP1180419.1 class 3 adenylate cyclase/TolB-like protein [Methylobacterium sp. PvR107]